MLKETLKMLTGSETMSEKIISQRCILCFEKYDDADLQNRKIMRLVCPLCTAERREHVSF